MSLAVTVTEASTVRLARGCRLRFDEARQQWLILAPERVFMPDEVSAAAVRRCVEEGVTVADVIDGFVVDYDAPRETIAVDVLAMLQDLADKGVLVV
ncbi:MAG: pyrroloquinoline quinone biosynthesis peptide chaperone PqqD [Alphaproteobacteria bacterium]